MGTGGVCSCEDQQVVYRAACSIVGYVMAVTASEDEVLGREDGRGFRKRGSDR